MKVYEVMAPTMSSGIILFIQYGKHLERKSIKTKKCKKCACIFSRSHQSAYCEHCRTIFQIAFKVWGWVNGLYHAYNLHIKHSMLC